MKTARYVLLSAIPFVLAACASSPADPRSISYQVDGETITLQDGKAEQALAPGSASRSVWRYFGNEARGDLDGDGLEDQALLLVNDSGGSGTFYYLVVALQRAEGWRGTNAMLLGDRIAPQGTRIEQGVITVNYAERPRGASFAEAPSVGVSRYFKVQNERLYRTHVIQQVTHRKWRWLYTQMNDDTRIQPVQAEAFTLVLRDDEQVMGTTDCNRFSGHYTAVDNKLSFGDFAATRMYCENSQEAEFLKRLGQVESYFVDEQGRLVLQLKFDSGAMVFQ